jgi:pyruvate kinase
MVKIAIETETHLDHEQIFKSKKLHRGKSVSSGICYSAVATAVNLNAKIIIASSFSGKTARYVSKFKPKAMVVGLSPLDRTLRKMQILWGVVPVKTLEVDSTDSLLEQAVETVKERKYVEKDDVMILTAGVPAGKSGVTNMIKAVIVE